MITAHNLVFGRKYGGYFLYPFTNTKFVELAISTRSGNIKIDKGDGSAVYAESPIRNYDFTTQSFSVSNINYSNPYTGNLKVITDLGNADVYSIAFSWVRDSPEYQNKYNIPVLEDFFAQFPNLYSIYFNVYAHEKYAHSLFAGNFAKLPNSVERVKIDTLQSSGDRIINFNDYSLNSKLKYFEALNDAPKLTGDLKLPPLCTFFKGTFLSSSTITYTSGKTWASSFDTLDLGNATLSATETDNLFIDMANSITTAIGSKVIRLANCYRTHASDSAVAYLQSLGYTITVLGVITPYELAYNFDGNFNDVNGVNNLAQNGTVTFTTDRKGGNTAIQMGSGYLETVNNLPASSVWSVSFWIKNKRLTGASYDTFLNLSNGITSVGIINISINKTANNRLTYVGSTTNGGGYVERYINMPTNNNWYHVVIVLDVALTGLNNQKFYVNGVQQNVSTVVSSEETASYQSGKLQVGSNKSYQFADLDDVKLFNRPLTQTEITNLYNE